MARKLTERQKLFVKHYLQDLNATQAYTHAGYSPKAAKEKASRLLSDPRIQTAIEKEMQKRAERLDITADKVLEELWSIATDDIGKYLEYRTEKTVVDREYDNVRGDFVDIIGYKTIAEMKDSKDVDTKNISELSVGKDGQLRFKLYSRADALVQVGKHLGMFVDKSKVEVTGKDGEAIQVERNNRINLESLSDDELRLLARILPE